MILTVSNVLVSSQTSHNNPPRSRKCTFLYIRWFMLLQKSLPPSWRKRGRRYKTHNPLVTNVDRLRWLHRPLGQVGGGGGLRYLACLGVWLLETGSRRACRDLSRALSSDVILLIFQPALSSHTTARYTQHPHFTQRASVRTLAFLRMWYGEPVIGSVLPVRHAGRRHLSPDTSAVSRFTPPRIQQTAPYCTLWTAQGLDLSMQSVA